MSVGLYLRSFCGFALQTIPCAILLLLPFREGAFAKGKRKAYVWMISLSIVFSLCYYDLHLKNGTVIRVRMTQKEIRDTLGDSFLPVSRGLVVNVEFIRQLGPKSCILKDGREILLSRSNTEEIHSAYAEYVFSQLSERDGASPDRTKRS